MEWICLSTTKKLYGPDEIMALRVPLLEMRDDLLGRMLEDTDMAAKERALTITIELLYRIAQGMR